MQSVESPVAPPEHFTGYLSPESAGRFLSISVKELERLRREGGGPLFVKLGRRTVRYAVIDLRTWADQFKYANTAEAAAKGGAL